MESELNTTTTGEIEDVFARVLRDAIYRGRDLVLIEPYNGPRPDEAHATIHLVCGQSQEHIARTVTRQKDGKLIEEIHGTSWCRMIIQFFGGDAFKTAVRARNALLAQDRLFDVLKTIGFGTFGEASAIPTAFQAKTEGRARFHVDFYANLSDRFEANEIEEVGGNILADGRPVPFHVERK